MVLLPLLLLLGVWRVIAGDNAYLLQTQSLPSDLNFMPGMANGHLGFTVFGNAIYMNGIYNGRGGDSRRARIPNWLNVSISQETIAELGLFASTYELALHSGHFRWRSTKPSGVDVLLLQRVYAHRYYTRALIYNMILRRVNASEPLTLKLTQNAGNEKSDAFDFTRLQTDASGFTVLQGLTKVTEHVEMQKQHRRIFVVFSEDNWVRGEKSLSLAIGQKELCYRYILTLDEDRMVAQKEMTAVLHSSAIELLAKQKSEWKALWNDFRIEIDGNLELAKTINAGIFYLASSLPSVNTFQPTSAFYGLSPTGLTRGQLDSDYEGHNFWDTEIWMLPVVTQLSIEWGRLLLEYRQAHLSGAQYNAQLTGYQGARFPWESAFTGTEVTNPCCPEVAEQEVHISADIAIALSRHFAITNDRQWLCGTAWPLAHEIADFLASRVTWSAETQQFHVHMVMGPDEDHSSVSDSVYTNVAFKQALEFASFTKGICADTGMEHCHWLNVAEKLCILYDSELDYHPEFMGYERNVLVKQADVVLLGYPLQFAMNSTTHLNDLLYYERVTRSSGPAMTHSMFAINFLDVGLIGSANQHFQHSYLEYVRPEFKVWSETKHGLNGSANFLTGIGGFLQAILNGYAGLRFRNDLNSIMEIRPIRHLPPGTNDIYIHGIKFAGAKFSLRIKSTNETQLKCTEIGNTALTFAQGGIVERPIHKGFAVRLHKDSTAFIHTQS